MNGKPILYIARNSALSDFPPPFNPENIRVSPHSAFLHHSRENGSGPRFKDLLEFSTNKVPTTLLAGTGCPRADDEPFEPHISIILGLGQDTLKQIEGDIHVLTATETLDGDELHYPPQCIDEYLKTPAGFPVGLWSNFVNNKTSIELLSDHMAAFKVGHDDFDKKRMRAECVFAGPEILKTLPYQLVEEGKWHAFELLDKYINEDGRQEGCMDNSFLMRKMCRV